ncbi:MAG: hypothetical protein RJQ10_18170 [Haliea sp.]|uniref:hypothetical protein n=1 Tax=Haliea sp. TaxID=1932666 RepID=UPI0032EC6FF9
MSKSNQRKQPITLNEAKETKYFKQACFACFIAARSVPRAIEHVPKYLNELATDMGEAWEESGKR